MADNTVPSATGQPDAPAGHAPSAAKKAGTCITFRKVAFSLPGKKRSDPPIQILENVSGFFAPGTVTATMGPSGAGKTTFLDIVTGRKKRGSIDGELLYDGKKATPAYLKSQTAYVEQFDTLLSVLTVRKMLMYQAELKCSRREPQEAKRARVEKILVELGLEKCADVAIGDALHPGISGGQAKRTNIGIALVTEPRVIFLDEPTSGLDSETSLDVVAILRKLADEGRTVMSTIHSPTSEAFRLFDSLLLMVKGRTVYFGALHGESGAAKYFETMSIMYDPATNLADFLIKETGNKAGSPDKGVVDFAGNWEKSAQCTASNAKLDEWISNLTAKSDGKSVQSEDKDFLPNNGFTAIGVLLKYRTSANYRFPDFMAPRFSPSVLFGLIISSLYAGVGEEAESSPLEVKARGNVAGALFMSVALPAFVAAGYVPSIVAERPLFYRETNDGCYSTFSYIMYKLVEEAIPQVFASLIFCLLTVYFIEMPGSFLWHWLIYFTTAQIGIAFAYCCCAVARNMDEANTLLPIYNVTGMFFTGVLFTYNEIPSGWKWYPWTNFMRYAWCAHMINHFGSKCEVGPESPAYDTPGCPIEYWGIDVGSIGTEVWKNYLVLAGIWVFFVGLAWFVMANVRHVQR